MKTLLLLVMMFCTMPVLASEPMVNPSQNTKYIMKCYPPNHAPTTDLLMSYKPLQYGFVAKRIDGFEMYITYGCIITSAEYNQ